MACVNGPADDVARFAPLVMEELANLVAAPSLWINRIVEKVMFTGCDEMHVKVSLDARLPGRYVEAASGTGTLLVPVILRDGRDLLNLDVRDASGNALSILNLQETSRVLRQAAKILLGRAFDLTPCAMERIREFLEVALQVWQDLDQEVALDQDLLRLARYLNENCRRDGVGEGDRLMAFWVVADIVQSPPVLAEIASDSVDRNILLKYSYSSFLPNVRRIRGASRLLHYGRTVYPANAQSYHLEIAAPVGLTPSQVTIAPTNQTMLLAPLPGNTVLERRWRGWDGRGQDKKNSQRVFHVNSSSVSPGWFPETWDVRVNFRLDRIGVVRGSSWAAITAFALTMVFYLNMHRVLAWFSPGVPPREGFSGVQYTSTDVTSRSIAVGAVIISLPPLLTAVLRGTDHHLVRRVRYGADFAIWLVCASFFLLGIAMIMLPAQNVFAWIARGVLVLEGCAFWLAGRAWMGGSYRDGVLTAVERWGSSSASVPSVRQRVAKMVATWAQKKQTKRTARAAARAQT